MYFNTKAFRWVTLALMGFFGAGLWRLQDADFQCHAIGASFFHCYYTSMTMLVLAGMATLILISAYCSGWLIKWPRHLFPHTKDDL